MGSFHGAYVNEGEREEEAGKKPSKGEREREEAIGRKKKGNMREREKVCLIN